jgi:hypothetical protein
MMQIEDYSRRIATAQNDKAELSRIAEELHALSSPDAARLRLRAIKLRMELNKGISTTLTLGTAPTPAIPFWLTELRLPAIDGRPLFRYKLSDAAFGHLQGALKARAADIVARPTNHLAAQFVLWGAEWFRRLYDGTGQRWDSLAQPLGLAGRWAQYRALADQGLAHWKIPPLRINGTHHRLAAIARQGGFPLAALEGGGAGWAPGFLERLVGLLLIQPDASLDTAERLAGSLMDRVPLKWRNPQIRIISAELAAGIVRLRRQAEAEGAPHGSLISAWLDRHHAGWRDELPIGLSGAAGRALLDGLIKAAAPVGQAEPIGARRLLRIGPDGRRDLVELQLAGLLTGSDGNEIGRGLEAEWSRLRVVASGEFARHVSGELAIAEPGEHGGWIARPTTNRALFDLSPLVPVTVELRGEGQRLTEPFVIPGGEALTGNLRVYVAEDSGGGPQQFRQVGSGSGAYRAGCLHIDILANWVCEPHGPDARCFPVLIDAAAGGRALWSVEGAAIVRTRRGDVYLVRGGQAADQRDRLAVEGARLHGGVHAGDTVPVFLGAPTFSLFEARHPRAPAPNEAWWRPRGSAQWHPNPVRARPGLCEFAWRDSHTGHIRDRTDAAILPAGFAITRRRTGNWLELGIVGWPGSVDVEAGQALGGNAWQFNLRAGSLSSAIIRLSMEDAQPVHLAVPLPHHAWIHSWTAGPVPPSETISISTINAYVARADGRCELFAELYDRNRRQMPQGVASWWVDGELPLSAIRDDLAALLRPHADLSATVKLSFNDGHSNAWQVSEFDHCLKPAGRAWQPDRAVTEVGVRITGRALHDAAREQDFGEYASSSDGAIAAFQLPNTLEGTWLAYLRSNERVLSRPCIVSGGALAATPDDVLQQAMLIVDWNERRDALLVLLDGMLAAPALPANRDMIRAIVNLALSLDGLPPSTFDILTLIKERPLLGTTILFFAAPSEVEPLMRLMEGIPAAWTLVPLNCWERAAAAVFEYLELSLPDELPAIATIISSRRATIAALDPVLAVLLNQPVKPVSLQHAAHAFLNRSCDRLQDRPNPFRPHHAPHLPAWPFDEQFWRALDAPVAAARHVTGRIALGAAEISCIKDIGRRHPRWFKDAFHAVLKE